LARSPPPLLQKKMRLASLGADDARIMLGQAVVYCPKSVDMWLALARLETYENARRVLNNARKELPAELAIWIAAAKLEEAQNNNEVVDKVVEKAVKLLSMSDNVIIKRDGWLREAETCESSGAIYTCGGELSSVQFS